MTRDRGTRTAVAARLGSAVARLRRPSVARRTWIAAAAGSVLGIWLASSVTTSVGPFDATAALRPAIHGDTTVRLGPLGSITLDTHDAPVSVELHVQQLRIGEAERIVRDPAVLAGLEDEIGDDARRAVRTLALRVLLAAVGGGLAGALAASFTRDAALRGVAAATVLVAGLGTATVVTYDANALAEPRYRGLMTIAPTAVGDVDALVDRFGEYRAQLTELVTNVVGLYRAAERLPTVDPGDRTIQVLHVSDIHLNPQAFDLIRLLVAQFHVDAVVDTGDVTDWGSEPESSALRPIGSVGVPYVWVRGNHDSAATQRAVAANPNAVVLDGGHADVAGLRFWGIGDPRFTPDKSQPVGQDAERKRIEEFAATLPAKVAASPGVDVLLVHDPRAAAGITDEVPLVLAGHTHEPGVRKVGDATLLVEGTTGGAGLRGLQGEYPHALTATVLYFDRSTRRLVAYDRISVRGLGETGARVERHIVGAPPRPED